MSIDLDKILETGVQLADSAKKTAADLAQKGKKQVDLMNAQTRLSKAQRQLGALVYSLEKNGEKNDLLVAKYVQAISSIEEEIELLKKQENRSGDFHTEAEFVQEPGTKTCPQCGAEVEEDALFCSGCGAQL